MFYSNTLAFIISFHIRIDLSSFLNIWCISTLTSNMDMVCLVTWIMTIGLWLELELIEYVVFDLSNCWVQHIGSLLINQQYLESIIIFAHNSSDKLHTFSSILTNHTFLLYFHKSFIACTCFVLSAYSGVFASVALKMRLTEFIQMPVYYLKKKILLVDFYSIL